jgi:hypothetical protein
LRNVGIGNELDVRSDRNRSFPTGIQLSEDVGIRRVPMKTVMDSDAIRSDLIVVSCTWVRIDERMGNEKQ